MDRFCAIAVPVAISYVTERTHNTFVLANELKAVLLPE